MGHDACCLPALPLECWYHALDFCSVYDLLKIWAKPNSHTTASHAQSEYLRHREMHTGRPLKDEVTTEVRSAWLMSLTMMHAFDVQALYPRKGFAHCLFHMAGIFDQGAFPFFASSRYAGVKRATTRLSANLQDEWPAFEKHLLKRFPITTETPKTDAVLQNMRKHSTHSNTHSTPEDNADVVARSAHTLLYVQQSPCAVYNGLP